MDPPRREKKLIRWKFKTGYAEQYKFNTTQQYFNKDHIPDYTFGNGAHPSFGGDRTTLYWYRHPGGSGLGAASDTLDRFTGGDISDDERKPSLSIDNTTY